MIDHYKTLDLSKDASQEEVRRAFRKLTKKFHPDRNVNRSHWATSQMKRLIEANRVLSNPKLREVYDRKHGHVYGHNRMTRAEAQRRYRPEKSTLATQAERILDCLLNGKAAHAVTEYENLCEREEAFDLSDHLALRDWVDAKFLLAEQYARRNETEKALALYESLYHHEQAHRRHSHFAQEVSDRILRLCTKAISPTRDPEQAVHYLTRALTLKLTRAKRAHLHKKLAESYLALGDDYTAERQLRIAFELKPDLKGAAKVSKRLGVTPEQVGGQN